MQDRQIQAVAVIGEAVLAEVLTVVTHDDHQRVIEGAASIQQLKQRADLRVQVRHARVIGVGQHREVLIGPTPPERST